MELDELVKRFLSEAKDKNLFGIHLFGGSMAYDSLERIGSLLTKIDNGIFL